MNNIEYSPQEQQQTENVFLVLNSNEDQNIINENIQAENQIFVVSTGRQPVEKNTPSIAAKYYREKKKNELSTLKGKVEQLEIENNRLKRICDDVQEKSEKQLRRLHYLESLFSNGNLQAIVPIIAHMQSQHTAGSESEKAGEVRNQLRNIQFSSINPGVCFHIKANQQTSICYCEKCNSQ